MGFTKGDAGRLDSRLQLIWYSMGGGSLRVWGAF